MATKSYEPKVGHKVHVNTRAGKSYADRKVTEVKSGATGAYYGVQLGDKKAPDVRFFRASELSRSLG